MIRSGIYLNIILSVALTMTACTLGKSQKVHKDHHSQKAVKYEEDLSGSRIRYQAPKDSTQITAVAKNKTAVTPSKDVTRELNLKMDTIARKNQNLKFAEGFRIQVYSGPSREDANKARDHVFDILPDVDVYPIFRQPVFRVTVGDYTDRLEANSAYVKLKRDFPNAILVPAKINIVMLK
jgi:hypothetical protein